MKRFKSKTIDGFAKVALHPSKALTIKGKGSCCNDADIPPDDDPNKSAMASNIVVLGG